MPSSISVIEDRSDFLATFPCALRQLAEESIKAEAAALISAANVLDTVAVGLALTPRQTSGWRTHTPRAPQLYGRRMAAAVAAELPKHKGSKNKNKKCGGGSEAAFAMCFDKAQDYDCFLDGLEEGTPK
jgi:hypothetical protein